MTYIGPQAVANALAAAGSDWDIGVMTAVSGAESSWDTTAISPTHDYGIMQININAWPELFQQYTWDDPGDNAKMAYHVWKIQGYRAWTTYTSGAYLRYLDQGRAAAGGTGEVESGLTGAAEPVQTADWAGWDFSVRINLTAAGLKTAAVTLNQWGPLFRDLMGNWS